MSTTVRRSTQPRRLDDILFVSYDKLDINFKFVVSDNEPVDLTFTNLTARAIANNHTEVAQPTVDVDATNGSIDLSWTADHVATLPMYFLVIIEGSTGDLDLSTVVGDRTWDDLADDLTWDDLNSDETFADTAYWDRSIVVARFVRNDGGMPDESIDLDGDPLLILVGDVA